MRNNFVYYNRNPDNEIERDCVVRAISLALDSHYLDTEEMLTKIGYHFDCEELEVSCYSYLLEHVLGFHVYDAYGRTVNDIVEDFPNNILLIRIEGHLTCSYFGKIYDIWDCTEEKSDRFWVIA